ncbi:hypothetical protein ZHAS_00014764 [Anopheles sinensis]|uniref:Uncharacterized protein n=1 Tax=Anopheles sinensis TaxID=74873 RepID=A0A084W968_ANOSI|nr:hypothetical protein ZHAS_00014764 [Anopheles sinensis]
MVIAGKAESVSVRSKPRLPGMHIQSVWGGWLLAQSSIYAQCPHRHRPNEDALNQ